MKIANINTGFIDIPGKISLNIYAQGCKLKCPNCQNPELQNFKYGQDIFLEQIKSICKSRVLPSWVCWLGGDATYQPEDFLEFNKYFHQQGYKVGLYTGRDFSDIIELTENVDLVIDGPWQGIPVGEEGSNQKTFLKINNFWKEVNFKDLANLLNT